MIKFHGLCPCEFCLLIIRINRFIIVVGWLWHISIETPRATNSEDVCTSRSAHRSCLNIIFLFLFLFLNVQFETCFVTSPSFVGTLLLYAFLVSLLLSFSLAFLLGLYFYERIFPFQDFLLFCHECPCVLLLSASRLFLFVSIC